MINHVRTLLLNRDGATRPSLSFFGEEYVPPGFQEVEVSSPISQVRASLFGSNPDDTLMNYHLRQYLSVLHSTEFEPYVYADDSRITYDIRLNEMTGFPTVSISELSSLSSDVSVSLIGDIESEAADLDMSKDWTVEIISSTVISVRYGSSERTYAANYSSGYTDLIPLRPSGMYVRLTSALPALPAGAAWLVDTIARPGISLADVIESLEASSNALAVMFGSGEPYKTFRRLWEKMRIFNYRLTGVLLAVALRTSEEMISSG